MIRDTDIIDHYWQRDQRAISESDEKYGAYCRAVAMNIVGDERDGEECVSDTWLAAWNTMPPKRPARLPAYFAAICRNSALNIIRREGQAKRGGGELAAALEELGECVAGSEDVQQEVERRELVRAIDGFLARLDGTERRVFVSRYWHMAALETLADSVDFSVCCTGETNIDQYIEYRAHELADSTALSYAEFMAANEVRALREFKQRYSENCGQWSEQVQDWYTPMDIRLAVPGNMDEATAAVRDEICAKYALTAPESAEEYNSPDETALARIGQEKFTDADLKIDLSYDTGAFTASGRAPASFELDYIKKGRLYINTWSTAFRFLDDAPSWMYKTANGDEVCIVLGGWGYGCVIYESANAYVLLSASGFVPASITGGDSTTDGMAAYRMERLADSIEFSRLK